MPIYRITFPNKTPVDVQGVSIRTEVVSTTTPPAVPTTFTLWGIAMGDPAYKIVSQSYSFAQPQINTVFWANNPTRYQIGLKVLLYNSSGQLAWQNAQGSLIALDWYLTPGGTTVSRCDALVTTATGNVLRLQGTNGQPCPTWVTTPDNECRPDEIKCTDLSDPRGFCCISCDALNTKIRVLI